jgi:hypothetical protein
MPARRRSTTVAVTLRHRQKVAQWQKSFLLSNA